MVASSWAISGFIATLLVAVALWGWDQAVHWMVPLFVIYTLVWFVGMALIDWIYEHRK